MLDEDVRDFLIESHENLENLDREIVELEQNPRDEKLVASVFRTIHTIKGTCGFFGYTTLGSVTHIAENLLSQARDRQREITPEFISLILETVDAVRKLLRHIEQDGAEGKDVYQDLRRRLEEAYHNVGGAQPDDAAAPVAVEREEARPQAPAKEAPVVAQVVAARVERALVETPAESAEPGPDVEARGGHAADTTIRVDVNLLDKLMNLVGELVLARNQLLQDTSTFGVSQTGTSQRLNLITRELQEGVMKTRMQPIGVVWNKFPRVVRDIAAQCRKQIEVEMEGSGTELDKTIIEAIKDPLTHIVRNSCDHGIEQPAVRLQSGKSPLGKITLRAYHEGGHVNIEMSDDGAGLNPEKIKRKAIEKGVIRPEAAEQMSPAQIVQLIFAPGFSTADQVTSISGRGVGMDVVRTNIERIGGTVDVSERRPCGTTVRIKIPLTLAIIPGLVVTLRGDGEKGEQRFVIPQASLLELVRLEGAEALRRVKSIHGTPVYQHRGTLLPLVYLSRVLGKTSKPDDNINIVLLQAEGSQLGLVVDDICDTQEIVVKPLSKLLKGLSCYMGATIMGDGKVALILDISGLARLAGVTSQAHQLESGKETSGAGSREVKQRLLLFSVGEYRRVVAPLTTVARLEKFERGRVEYASGRPVIHYRGSILPLLSFANMLNPAVESRIPDEEELQVVVFTNKERSAGLLVDKIEDIIEETLKVSKASTTAGLLGSGVVGGKITDILDLYALTQACGDDWLTGASAEGQAVPSLLLIEPSSIVREMMRGHLEMSGYGVSETSDAAEALALLARQTFDAVLCGLDALSAQAADVMKALQEGPQSQHAPVIALTDAPCSQAELLDKGFAGASRKTDREGVLERLQSLLALERTARAECVTAGEVQ